MIVLLISCALQNIFADEIKERTTAGLGFEFGTRFMSFSKRNFKNGGANYFRLNMTNHDEARYFLHNENGSISVESGDAATVLTANVIGLGSGLLMAEKVSVNIIVGNATIIGVSNTGSGLNSISSIQSTSPVADVEVGWRIVNKSVSLSSGLAYRYLILSNPICVTDDSGKERNISDMSSMSIFVSINYSF